MFFIDFPLRHLVAFLYLKPKSRITDNIIVESGFTSDSDLGWFLQFFRVPRKELFENCYFLKVLTTALTYNLYFPDNGKYISNLLLEAVIKKHDMKTYFLKSFIAGPGCTVPKYYFIDTLQFDSLFILLNAFPEILTEYFQSKAAKLEFEQFYRLSSSNGKVPDEDQLRSTYKTYSPVSRTVNPNSENVIGYIYAQYSNHQYVPSKNYGHVDIENFRKFLSNCVGYGNRNVELLLIQFQQLYDAFLTKFSNCYSINISKSTHKLNSYNTFDEKEPAEEEDKLKCLNIRNFLISTFDHLRSLPSDGELEDYIKIMMHWSVKGKARDTYRFYHVEVDAAKITTDHEFILRLYLNPKFHQFFRNYTIKMSSDSLLSVLRSPDLFEVFEELFSHFGRLIEFDYFEILQFLRPEYEFKIFEKFTGLSLCDCLATKYHKIQGPQHTKIAFNVLFFFHHRSLILYCLYKPQFIESAYYYGRDPRSYSCAEITPNSIMNQVYILILNDSTRASNKLKQLFQNFSSSEIIHQDENRYVFSEFNKIILESKTKKPSLEDEDEY